MPELLGRTGGLFHPRSLAGQGPHSGHQAAIPSAAIPPVVTVLSPDAVVRSRGRSGGNCLYFPLRFSERNRNYTGGLALRLITNSHALSIWYRPGGLKHVLSIIRMLSRQQSPRPLSLRGRGNLRLCRALIPRAVQALSACGGSPPTLFCLAAEELRKLHTEALHPP